MSKIDESEKVSQVSSRRLFALGRLVLLFVLAIALVYWLFGWIKGSFFYVHENNSPKIDNRFILPSRNFLKNKNIQNITYAQKKATENVFTKKNIPFRSFEIKKRDEKTLGELFCFFMLETILIGRALKINPYNQPAVELIKKETKKILV